MARHVGERHGDHRRAGIGETRRDGEQHRAAPARGAQSGGRGHQRAAAGHDGAQGRRDVVVRVAGRVMVPGRGHREERGDGQHHGQRRDPGRPAERAARPDAHDDHRDDELPRHQHLHGRQRARPQRDRVRREPADLGGDPQQPQGLAGQQEQQPGPSGRRLRRSGRLPLLHRGPGPVKDGGGQRGHDHQGHGTTLEAMHRVRPSGLSPIHP